jgi:Fe-S-cluster containining protein
MTPALPLIDSCDGCGACCRVVTLPPFVRHIDGTGEDGWERLRWDRPDLMDELSQAARSVKSTGAVSFGTPCSWYDPASCRCRHYDYRPAACRAFALGGIDCRDARRRAGMG